MDLGRFFTKVLKDDNARWDPQRDCAKFMSAMINHPDPLDLLFRLTNPNELGMKRLRSAMTHDGSPAYVAAYVVPFLRVLSGDALCAGACRAPLVELLKSIYSLPGVLGCMLAAVKSGHVADASPIGWFLLTLAAEMEEVRLNPEVRQLTAELKAADGPAGKVAQRLMVVLAPGGGGGDGGGGGGGGGGAGAGARRGPAALGSAGGQRSIPDQRRSGVETLEDLLDAGPGGRHDNDHVDYRSIKIMTTSEEALCTRAPYLPRSDDLVDAAAHGGPQQSHRSAAEREAALLDRQFRLLREDFMGPLRESLSALGFNNQAASTAAAAAAAASQGPAVQAQLQQQQQKPHTQSKKQQRQEKQQQSASAARFGQRNVYPLVAVVGTEQKPRACVMVAVALPPGHRASRLKSQKEREEFWSEYGKGTLSSDALVCIVRSPVPGQALEPLLFCTVARREPKEMARPWPEVGLAFERGQEAAAERLLQELGRGVKLREDGLLVVQVSTSFFSMRPVLSCLQAITGVPLAEELALGRPAEPLSYLPYNVVSQELSILSGRGLTLDPSQEDALRRCLTQRVALVQGPPGTGKTFVGALLCEAIVRQSAETILVVCYTNHALDQFLEALLSKGIKEIVRVGGRSKSKELARYNLRELAGPGNANRGRMSQAEFRRFQVLKAILADDLEAKVELLRAKLCATGGALDQDEQEALLQHPQQQQQQQQQTTGAGRQPSAATAGSQKRGMRGGGGGSGSSAAAAGDGGQPSSEPSTSGDGSSRLAASGSINRPVQELDLDLWGEMHILLQEDYEDEYEQLMDLYGEEGGNTWRAWLSGQSRRPVGQDDDRADGWQPAREDTRAAGGSGGVMSYKRAEAMLFRRMAESNNSTVGQQQQQQGPAGASSYEAAASTSGGPDQGGGRSMGHGGSSVGGGFGRDATTDLWRLPHAERMRLAAQWLRELRALWAEDLASTLIRRNKLQQQIRALHDGASIAVLRQARVIGCTTTGAAMYKELLRDVEVDPGVVLVEEAGELLEAHVLTSLSPRTKHLIMIGDHKQLRPKVECYNLSVQSGHGFDLNVSLFERLVLSGFPHTTLSVQHRMHPDISALIQHTYPQLRNGPRVSDHPPVKGLQPGRRVVFVDHSEPELGEKEKGMWGAGADHVSKVNMHEVAMVREIVRYLLRQGYQTGQLVVLTPYLGQLLELQEELSRDMQVLLDEMDIRDLFAVATGQALESVLAASAGSGSGSRGRKGAAAAAAAAHGGGGGREGVRVATIDNYQGEEADVVIASLVRCNGAGSVGFLREPERINVLLSRARHGMVLVGSAATLRHAKHPEGRRHWGVVLDALAARGALLPGLPAACQRHGTANLLTAPESFAALAPDGGCERPCLAVLKCGHRCTRRCHAYDPGHTGVLCAEEVAEDCGQGHMLTRKCHQDRRDVVCRTCTEIRKVEESERAAIAKMEEQAARRRQQAELEAARLRARIDHLQRQQAELEAARRQRQEAVRLELEMQTMQKQVELQDKYGALEMKDWEQEQRAQAAQQLQEMEVDARLQAQLKREEQAAKAQQQAEEAALRQLAATEEQLRQVEAQREEALQRIANDTRRLAAQADDTRRTAESSASRTQHRFRSMSAWKEAVAAAANDAPKSLSELRQQITAAAAPSPEAARDTEDALEMVFGGAGIGRCLLAYAGVGEDGAATTAAATGTRADDNPPHLRRALALMEDGKWLDAYKTLSSQAGRKPADTDAAAGAPPDGGADPVRTALLGICRTKLGLPVPEPTKPGAAASASAAGARAPRKDAQAQQKGTSAAAAAAAAAAALKPRSAPQPKPTTGEATTTASAAAAAGGHPAEHLAAALEAAVQLPSQPPGPSGSAPQPQRSATARAAGWALACLLHPHVDRLLPAALRSEAVRLLKERSALLMGPTMAAAAAAAGGGDGATGASRDPAQWRERARNSPAFTKLLQLTGLAPVKRAMFQLAAMVDLDKERGRPLGDKQYNVRFYGNPGTGKTTVARIYAELLKELGVLPGAEVVETSGAELLTGGVTKLKEQLGKLDKGGVLFLDEAYQLNPKTNPMGAQVLDYLLPELENRRGKLVVVLAGYKKQMDELMTHNEGLPSRFVQEFTFPDYSDEELFTIFKDLIATDKKPCFTVADERHLRIAARRLGRQRGTTGFGNARAVRNAYEQAQRRQAARVLAEREAGRKPKPLELVREDLLGLKYLDVSTCSALRELEAMRGLVAVKQQVHDLLQLIRTNAELEEQERPLKTINLNRIFLGNPGTGKTTVAGLYGRILRDLGLLSKGDVEVRVPADFVGSVLGESEKRTEGILEATKGCVLVIDEAYGLYSDGGRDPFREAVVDTLVARVQGVPGDDRCVLMLGYEEQLETMMRKANPGLARRFQMREAWRFEDYGPEDLLAITREAAKKRGWALGEAALLAAVEALEQERRKPNFGNAGAVNNLLSTATMRMEARLRSLPPERRAAEVPQPEDFLPPRTGGDPAGIFDDLIGCKEVLAKLREWRATILACQAMGRDPLQSFELNFRFVGAPGTGKTTVARRVGRLFESLGLLAGSEMVSCSASDFVTGYVNQASGKTREIFKKAVGGVLFIDEAYRLNPRLGGPFMQEVLDEIVQLLTEPAFMGKMVVILAGYEGQIEELMTVNPGLKSRFSQRLHFPDFSAGDAAALMRQQLRKEYGLELQAEADAALEGMAGQLVAAPNWSNGRDVGTWAKRTFTAFSSRNFSDPGGQGEQQQQLAAVQDSDWVQLSDLQAGLRTLLEDKRPPGGPAAAAAGGNTAPAAGSAPGDGSSATPPSTGGPFAMPYAFDTAVARAPPPPPVKIDTAVPPPAVDATVATDVAQHQQAADATPAVPPQEGPSGADFGGLSPAFLRAMQDGLETLGHDLSSLDAVQALAGDPNLASQLLPYLQSVPGVTDVNMLREMVRQWQQMIAKRMEEERELARKRRRPVWRCAVCGRYGCPVAPYIERYEEI